MPKLKRVPVTMASKDHPPTPAHSCKCGKVHLAKLGGEQVVITGPGYLTENQFVNCGHCRWKIRYAPMPVWETPSGERHSTRGYLKSRKL